MNKIFSLTLVAFLVGCGGGGGATSSTAQGNSTTPSKQENGEKTKPLKADEDGMIKTIKLATGSAEDIAVSKDTLYVAKGKDGVDIVNIGYKDSLSTEFITAISGINAKSVTVSDDGKQLYIVNQQGYVNIYDISNVSSPKKGKTTTQQEITKEVKTKDGKYKFIPKDKDGLEIYNIREKAAEAYFNKSSAYDVVLADNDSKALIAAGASGINLLDITKPTEPNLLVNFSINGGTKGLSLNKEEGILFVANGDKGVLVYSLNILLDKLSK